MSRKHLNRYVAEFTERHDVRATDTLEQMAGFVAGIEGKCLTLQDSDRGRRALIESAVEEFGKPSSQAGVKDSGSAS